MTGVEPGYTYVVIETAVAAYNAGEQYNTLAKDDQRVKWFGSIYIEPGTVTDFSTMYIMLDNVLGTAGVGLEKSADEATGRETLFAGAQTVTYTLSPDVDNSTGLESFIVTDSGLTAYHVVDGVETEVYDTDTDGDGTFDAFQGYSLNTVAIGAPSHDPTIYGKTEAETPIKATVKFFGFDDTKIDEKELSANESYTTTEGDVKYVTISYAADNMPTYDGYQYALGMTFEPGDITVIATLKQHQDGPTVLTIDKVCNNADVFLSYRPCDASGERLEEALTDEDDAEVNITFDQPDIPVIALYKQASEDTVDPQTGEIHHAIATLGSQFSYTIHLVNTTPNLPLKSPFLLDLLPKGATFHSATLKGTVPAGFSIESIDQYVQGELTSADAMNVTRINFKGSLKYGEDVYVEIIIDVGKEVELHGTDIVNFAFMSSSEPTYKSTYNPTGAPFRDYRDNQTYAQELPDVGESLQPSLPRNTAEAMQLLIQDIGDFGYVGDGTTNPWGSTALIDLVKAVRADQDTDNNGNLLDFSTTRLAQASNGAAPNSTDEGGWVEYQLSLTNNADVLMGKTNSTNRSY